MLKVLGTFDATSGSGLVQIPKYTNTADLASILKVTSSTSSEVQGSKSITVSNPNNSSNIVSPEWHDISFSNESLLDTVTGKTVTISCTYKFVENRFGASLSALQTTSSNSQGGGGTVLFTDNFPLGNVSSSYSFWIKLNIDDIAAFTIDQIFILDCNNVGGAGAGGVRNFWLYKVNNVWVSCANFDGDPVSPSVNKIDGGDITDGKWHNVTVTYGSGTAKYFLDNVLQGTLTGLTLNTAVNGNGTWTVFSGQQYWSCRGTISDIKIYSRTLTNVEVATLYYGTRRAIKISSVNNNIVFGNPVTLNWSVNNLAGKVSSYLIKNSLRDYVEYFSFDYLFNKDRGNLKLSSPNLNTKFSVKSGGGNNGNYLMANNSTGALYLSDPRSLLMSRNDATISFWYNPFLDTGSDKFLISTHQFNTDKGWGIKVYNSGKDLKLFGCSTTPFISATDYIVQNLSYNTWNHIVLIISGSTKKISAYINGKFIGESSGSFNNWDNDKLVFFGIVDSRNYDMINCGIDELKIYDRKLTHKEVNSLYISDSGIKISPLSLANITDSLSIINPSLTDIYNSPGVIARVDSVSYPNIYDETPVKFKSALPLNSEHFALFQADNGDKSGNRRDLIPMNSSGSVVFGLNRFFENKAILMADTTYKRYFNSSSSELNLGTDNFTVSVWFKQSIISSSAALVSIRNVGGYGTWWSLFVDSFEYDNGGISSYAGIGYNAANIKNKWYNLTLRRNGLLFEVFLNGNKIAEGSNGINYNFNQTGIFQIGCNSLHANNPYLYGYLDEVRIFNQAISDNAIKAISRGIVINELRQNKSLNPMIHYKFDDFSNLGFDSSGNGYNGAVTGSISLTTTRFDNKNGLILDTKDKVVTFTGSLPVKMTAPMTGVCIFSSIHSGSNVNSNVIVRFLEGTTSKFILTIDNGKLVPMIGSQTVIYDRVSNTIVNDGKLHIAILRYTGTNRELFIDGIKEYSLAGLSDNVSSEYGISNTIGMLSSTDATRDNPNHVIDEVMVFNRALTLSEIDYLSEPFKTLKATNFQTSPSDNISIDYTPYALEGELVDVYYDDGKADNIPSGLIGEYLLNGNTLDTSSISNHGISTSIQYGVGRTGIAGECALFNGINSKITLPYISSQKTGNIFTISMWVRIDNIYSRGCIMSRSTAQDTDSNGQEWCIQQLANSVINIFINVSQNGGSWGDVNYNTGSVGSGWHHLLWEVDATLGKVDPYNRIFIDGIFAGQTWNGNVITELNKDITIGWTNTVAYFKGAIQEIRIYNRILSDDEKFSLTYGNSLVNQFNNNLISYYPFNVDTNDKKSSYNLSNSNCTLVDNDFYRFNGTNSYMELTSTALRDQMVNEFTIICMVRSYNKYDWNYIITVGGSPSGFDVLFYWDNQSTNKTVFSGAVRLSNGDNHYGVIRGVLQDKKWRTLALTFKNGVMSIYDGMSYSKTVIDTLLIKRTSDAITIGCQKSNMSNFTKMDLKQLRIYNKALSLEELNHIRDLNNSLSNRLIAYYPFKSDTNDYSGNNFHLTNNNATKDTITINGCGYNLNGTNAYMSLNNAIFRNLIQNEITVTFWYRKTSAYGENNHEIVVFNSISVNPWADICFKTSPMGIYTYYAKEGDSAARMSQYLPILDYNKYVFCAYSMSQDKILTLTDNGMVITSDMSDCIDFMKRSNLMEIGRYLTECYGFSIANLRIYNYGLNEDELRKIYNLEKSYSDKPDSVLNGLVGNYTFNGDTLDYSSNKINMINNGMTFTNNRNGDTNSALNINNNSYGDLGTDSRLKFVGSSFSINLWILKKVATGNNQIYIITNGMDVYQSYIVRPDGFLIAHSGIRFDSTYLRIADQDLDIVNPVDVWYMLTCVLDLPNKVVKLYKNGTLVSQATAPSIDISNSRNIYIGRSLYGNPYEYPFTGYIDSLRFYNKVLSQEEINNLLTL